jgi:perosamine synthetase
MGESVYKFEEEFAKFCGVKHAVATNSGTFALQLSLEALGINTQDQVLTTPNSFIATANSIYFAGATPKFADVNPDTFNLDPAKAQHRMGKEVKALMPVHLYGYPAEMDQFVTLAKENNCAIVEDCCQAHGAKYYGKRVGSMGNVGCFSFYPSKNMTVCGDGGMAVTNDGDIAKTISKLRDCGRKSHYEHDIFGITARLNTVNAAVGRVQLQRLEEWNNKRRNVARLYNKLLVDIEGLDLPPAETNQVTPVYHLYVVRTDYRDELKTFLEASGIQCGIHYPVPIHLQPVYKQAYGYTEGTYPVTEQLCSQVLSLPMYPDMPQESIEKVANKIREFYQTKLKTVTAAPLISQVAQQYSSKVN